MADKVKIGIIGTGNIAPAYVRGSAAFDALELVACADIDMDRAVKFAEENGIKALSVADMLADPEIEIVVNLTIPSVHKDVTLQILNAGKHAYSEKPLGIAREEGQEILETAKAKGLRVGCAPDTFLGGGGQTSRKIIDDGWIGTPIAATAFFMGHGMEHWHPNPEFFYQPGAGPVFDLGPYYVTALINLLGPVKTVSGSARITFPQRTITSQPLYGQKFDVNIETTVAGVLNFESGLIATTIFSFDIWAHQLPRIEIYGTEGTLIVPDPNTFKGPVKVWTTTDREFREVPLAYSDTVGRGIGVADMANAIKSGRPHRASGDLAFHALDVMQAMHEAGTSGKQVEIASTVQRPAALPLGLQQGKVDA